MKVKIYYENGKVRITRIAENGYESEMYKVNDGDVVEINISPEVTIKGKQYTASSKL